MNSRRLGRAQKLQYLLQWKGYSRAHDSWQDATEVHAPELVQEYHTRKWSAIHVAATIKGAVKPASNAPPSSSISHINMSNGSSSPASTFSFIYPTTDCEETPTAGTTNDHQYDDQVVLFGAGATGQQSIGANPSLADFNPLRVNIALCDAWFQLEAVYCNNTWWEAFQDNGSETSESGSSNVPS
jgi:Chromo (CHRromatin Organisation MOdifier) domain